MTALRFKKRPFIAMKRILILPVEYTTIFGPPAMGSMNANEAANVTASRSWTWSYPFICAV
eukprot:CAMPEP_0195049988 /NCGR_PEP_ID=MMETSP0347-20130606/62574_1 /TAXON_ID=2932 /ORGANISM="Alexandrium fundyense, Strain CCMP1719" /LENGTH=60 /DNA_ID=CAMNT_0040078841 /DNA_START=39 /DNA_END=218 /DNA_ORIENTATION=+